MNLGGCDARAHRRQFLGFVGDDRDALEAEVVLQVLRQAIEDLLRLARALNGLGELEQLIDGLGAGVDLTDGLLVG